MPAWDEQRKAFVLTEQEFGNRLPVLKADMVKPGDKLVVCCTEKWYLPPANRVANGKMIWWVARMYEDGSVRKAYSTHEDEEDARKFAADHNLLRTMMRAEEGDTFERLARTKQAQADAEKAKPKNLFDGWQPGTPARSIPREPPPPKKPALGGLSEDLAAAVNEQRRKDGV
jgi:hypothetical protein